jgi:hypothetical protein
LFTVSLPNRVFVVKESPHFNMTIAMQNTSKLINDSLATGAIATAATTAAASACGRIEDGEPIAPLNAISHILYGDEAAAHNEPSAKYTMPGILLNTAAITGWAVVHELMFNGRRRPQTLPAALAAGAATSALAYVTDYYIVPKRFTPGFEKRLSNSSLACIYGTLAASLGIASWLRHRSRDD